MKREKILKILEKEIKPKRFIHTLGVEETAVRLAEIYGVDELKASTAALLHDCAKSMDAKDKISLCKKNGVEISDLELVNPELLHAKAGSFYAKERYGIEDSEILNAIYYHTTGKAQMSLLEEIIFVADYIEPNRTHSELLPSLRELAKLNLHKTTAIIYRETLLHLENKKSAIIEESKLAFDYYKQFLDE